MNDSPSACCSVPAAPQIHLPDAVEVEFAAALMLKAVTAQYRLHMAAEVYAALRAGHIRINLHQRHALHDVALAHQALEARRTTGCSVLLP